MVKSEALTDMIESHQITLMDSVRAPVNFGLKQLYVTDIFSTIVAKACTIIRYST